MSFVYSFAKFFIVVPPITEVKYHVLIPMMFPQKFSNLQVIVKKRTSSMLFLNVLSKPEAGNDIAITRFVM
jgi:hypothetical protein